MKLHHTLLVVASGIALSSCASITKDSNQPIRVETYNQENTMVEDVTCSAKNERGEWSTKTPGSLVVHRSGQNLEVRCYKENSATGFATLVSRANGGMWGNILFGGGIGAIVDHNKGTAYSYPDWVKVVLGDNLVFDRKNNVDNQIMTGQAATGEVLKKIEADKQKEAQEAKKLAEENSVTLPQQQTTATKTTTAGE
jgi:hypothetical protein